MLLKTHVSYLNVIISIISIITNAVLNYILIPKYGAVGAAIATGISYCVFFWLRTLFSRIQDLELGDTLDDGTTLGSYSEALEKVGINIKTQSGNLKDMDDILDEMGAKWSTLSKDQQVALAQSVAGVRQYNQLMALMNN